MSNEGPGSAPSSIGPQGSANAAPADPATQNVASEGSPTVGATSDTSTTTQGALDAGTPGAPAATTESDAAGLKIAEGLPPQVLEFAKDNGLSQQQLDASLGFFGNMLDVQNKLQQDQMLQAGRAHLESWGPNKTYNLGLGRQALKTIDKGGVLTKLLNDTGYGNHPVILQSLFELGQQLQEGGFISATASLPAGQRTHAQVLYGDDHPN